jgi:hypothetical protein
LKPSRKLGLNESSLIKTEFLDLVAFAERRFFSFEAQEVLSLNPESSVFGSFSMINQNPKRECSKNFLLSNLTCSRQSFHKNQSFTMTEVQVMILENLKNTLRPKTNFQGSVFAVPGFFTQAQKIHLKNLANHSKLRPLAFVNQDLLVSVVLALDRLDDKEKFALGFTVKTDHVSVSLLKFFSVTVNKGKVTEKKIESLKLVRSEFSFEFGWNSVEDHLARVLVQQVQLKCFQGLSGGVSLVKVKEKIRKLIEKLQTVPELILKFDDLAEGCKETIEISRAAIEDFLQLNQEEILKPVQKLLNQDLPISSLIFSHQSEQYFEKLLSSVIKTRNCTSNHAAAVGASLLATNYSSEVHVRPLWVGQAFQFNSQVIITSKESGKVRTKPLFDQDSLFGTSKKFGFSSIEDLHLELQVDYGQGFVKTSEYHLNEVKDFAGKYQQNAFVVLEFALDDFGIFELSGAEVKVEVELEFEREVIEKEKEEVSENSTNLNQGEGKERDVNDTQSEEEQEKVNENQEIQDIDFNETQENLNQTQENIEKNDTQDKTSEEDSTPKYEKVLKKKTIKIPLSINQVVTEKLELGELSTSQISRLSKLSSSESLLSDLQSFKSSLLSLYSSESLLLSSSDRQSLLSSEDESWLSSFPSLVNQASSFSSLRSLQQQLLFLVSSTKQRKSDLSSLESLKIYTSSSFDSLLTELKDLVQSKPWLPSEEVENLSKEIIETKTWLMGLYEKQKISQEMSNLQFNSAKVQGKINRITYKMQVLSKTKQKKTDL